MLRPHGLSSSATTDERAASFDSWFDADVDAAISIIPLITRLGTNLERIVGSTQTAHAFAQLKNCDLDWRDGVERTEFYLETQLGASLTGLSAYAVFGLLGSEYLSEHSVSETLNVLEALLRDCPPELWLPNSDREPIIPTLQMARARWNLDQGGGVEAEGLALLGGVKLSRIRNMISGSSPELPKDATGLISNEAARAWLSKREEFLPTVVIEASARGELGEEWITPVFLPVARDGSMFHPSLIRSGAYRIGEKGGEESVEDFQMALAKLQTMPVAKWRRPNDQGNWGIVSAIEWRRVDLKSL